MAATLELGSNPKLAKRTGLSTSTIHRLRNGDVDATLSTLEALSKAFDLEPWQLLVANFDPKNRPVLQPLSEQERRLYARLAEVAKEIKEGG
jgi:transcriptional regulator with XRE-family HTH domain